MIVFGLTITSIGGKKSVFFPLDCHLFCLYHTGEKEQFGPLPLTLGLDDGVPVKVVLDVVCSQHASHLEVSQRESVLLLAQLAEVSWTQKQRCHTEYPGLSLITRKVKG